MINYNIHAYALTETNPSFSDIPANKSQALANGNQTISSNYQAPADDYQTSSNHNQAPSNDNQTLSNDYQIPTGGDQTSSSNYQAPADDYQISSNDNQTSANDNQTPSNDNQTSANDYFILFFNKLIKYFSPRFFHGGGISLPGKVALARCNASYLASFYGFPAFLPANSGQKPGAMCQSMFVLQYIQLLMNVKFKT